MQKQGCDTCTPCAGLWLERPLPLIWKLEIQKLFNSWHVLWAGHRIGLCTCATAWEGCSITAYMLSCYWRIKWHPQFVLLSMRACGCRSISLQKFFVLESSTASLLCKAPPVCVLARCTCMCIFGCVPAELLWCLICRQHFPHLCMLSIYSVPRLTCFRLVGCKVHKLC